MKLDFPLSTYLDDSVQFSAQRLVNMYVEEAEVSGPKNASKRVHTPGTLFFTEFFPDDGEGIRAQYTTDEGRFFVVCGSGFFEVVSDGTVTLRGSIASFIINEVSIADNGQVICIVDGISGWFFNLDTNVFAEITDTTFTTSIAGASSVVFMDGYFAWGAINNPNTSGVLWFLSDLDVTDPANCVGPNFAGADSDATAIRKMIVRGSELIIFKGTKTEFWYNSGNPLFAFERRPTTISETGTISAKTVSQIRNVVFFVGSDRDGDSVVYAIEDFSARRISTNPIEKSLFKTKDLSDAYGFTYHEDGKYFYVLTIPASDTTVVYEMDNQLWHERSSLQLDTGLQGRHKVSSAGFFNRKTYVGDFTSNVLFRYSKDFFTENGTPIVRDVYLPHVSEEGRLIMVSRLEIDAQKGIGITGIVPPAGDLAVNPVIELRISRDGGMTYGQPRTKPLGKIGEYRKRASFDGIGISRDFVYNLRSSAPVPHYWIITYQEMKVSTYA